MARNRDELEADFQQYYGLDLEQMGSAYSLTHAATLAAQLPTESRCIKAVVDGAEWSNEMQMLSQIEHDIRVFMWALGGSKGQKKPSFPKRIQPPTKKKEIERRLEATDFEEIDRRLGIRR